MSVDQESARRLAAQRRHQQEAEARGAEQPEALQHGQEGDPAAALARIERQIGADDPILADRLTRVRLAQAGQVESMRRSHDWVTRVDALRRAYERKDTTQYEHPAVVWQSNPETGEDTVTSRNRGIIESTDGKRTQMYVTPMERMAQSVEHAMRAATVLFQFRLMEMRGQMKIEDVRGYMERVVLHDEEIPEGQREAAILAKIEELFVVGEEQQHDEILRDEMGDASVKTEEDYSFTLRLRTLASPVAVERLNGIVGMSLLRQQEELQKELADKYGEDSPAYQALAALYHLMGIKTF